CRNIEEGRNKVAKSHTRNGFWPPSPSLDALRPQPGLARGWGCGRAPTVTASKRTPLPATRPKGGDHRSPAATRANVARLRATLAQDVNPRRSPHEDWRNHENRTQTPRRDQTVRAESASQ